MRRQAKLYERQESHHVEPSSFHDHLRRHEAINMKRADAFTLAIVVRLVNQLVGYGILHYPQTPDSFAWGVAA
jgi:hypothetical protein